MDSSLLFISGLPATKYTKSSKANIISHKPTYSISTTKRCLVHINTNAKTKTIMAASSNEQSAPAAPTYAVTLAPTEELSWVDAKTGQSIIPSQQEKENMFIDALYAYYAGKPMLSNEDFDTLKDDLTWQGSNVIRLSREELTFLQAARAYQSGQSIMSDAEFDTLREELKKKQSIVALQTDPKCSLITQTCWSDCTEDRFRQSVLYLPAAGIAAIVWAVVSYFTPLADQSPLVSLAAGAPFIFVFAKIGTELILPDPLILTGKCPSCAAQQRVYFGNVATVEGYKDFAECKCTNCEAQLTLDKAKRRFRLDMIASKKPSKEKKPAAATQDE